MSFPNLSQKFNYSTPSRSPREHQISISIDINENPIRKITIVDESMKYAQEMLNALTPRTSL